MTTYHYVLLVSLICGAGLGYGASFAGNEKKDTVTGASIGLLLAGCLCGLKWVFSP